MLLQVNVLIDDASNAVLCDFGLARIKADADSQTNAMSLPSVAGSRNWMAPERLRGESPRAPSDVYAFGLTMYEVCSLRLLSKLDPELDAQIYTGEIPLSEVAAQDFLLLVGDQNVRPKRPTKEEASQLTDSIWKLADMCWQGQASKRPDATYIGRVLEGIKQTLVCVFLFIFA